PTIGHLDPLFLKLMDEIKELLQYAFQTNNELTLPISAPGSAGMEACFVNLVSPGDKVIVCRNGVFGGRMKENVERIGATAIMVEDSWGQPIDLEKVEQAFADNTGVAVLAFVHAETSTGVVSDAASLCGLAARHGALTIVDAVTSLGGIELKVGEWGADAVYSGTQKCLSCVPGISPVTFSPSAVERIQSRDTAVQSWFLDMQLIMGYWGRKGQRAYHHTAPVNDLYALHESLVMLTEEGLESAFERHRLNHLALVTGLESMGMEMAVAPEYRLPQLNLVKIPEGIDDGAVRSALLNDFGLEIGAGLGTLAGSTWRIGLMGCSSSAENVMFFLAALESVLASQGAVANEHAGQKAARLIYQDSLKKVVQ
ncbi:MAG: pyridoxal-phosphate-dependent aminotransferase family protein, partial [Pseudomonadales bacterium]